MRVRDIEAKLASVRGSVETVPDTFDLGSEPVPVPWATPSYTESLPDVRATRLFDYPSTTDMGYFGKRDALFLITAFTHTLN